MNFRELLTSLGIDAKSVSKKTQDSIKSYERVERLAAQARADLEKPGITEKKKALTLSELQAAEQLLPSLDAQLQVDIQRYFDNKDKYQERGKKLNEIKKAKAVTPATTEAVPAVAAAESPAVEEVVVAVESTVETVVTEPVVETPAAETVIETVLENTALPVAEETITSATEAEPAAVIATEEVAVAAEEIVVEEKKEKKKSSGLGTVLGIIAVVVLAAVGINQARKN